MLIDSCGRREDPSIGLHSEQRGMKIQGKGRSQTEGIAFRVNETTNNEERD